MNTRGLRSDPCGTPFSDQCSEGPVNCDVNSWIRAIITMWIVLSLFPVWRWATAASPCCCFTVKHQLQSDLKEPEWICWLVNSTDWLLTASLCSPKWFLTSKHADIINHQLSCQTSGELQGFIGRWRALTPPSSSFSSSWYNTDKS